jgi:UDP-N-acetylmuramoyl-tripeptide--D-alanyl-D-alanine ligase
MEVTHRPDGVTIVNDAYNANPESMLAALAALISVAEGRRTWAVLGKMTELGADTTTEHAHISAAAARLGVTRLVAVDAPQYSAARPGAAEHVPDIDAALALLDTELRPDDVVLVKASRTAGLDRIAGALLDNHATRPTDALGP